MAEDKIDIRALIDAIVEGRPTVTQAMVDKQTDPERKSILEGLLALSARQRHLEERSREVDDELAESNRFLDSIVENLPNMVFVKDASNLRFVRVNRAAEELIGHTQAELIGKCDHDFFPEAQADFFASNDRAVLANKELVDIPEEPIHTRHRGTRILHTKKIPILSQDGKPIYLLGLSDDVTERHFTQIELEKAKVEAERANRAKSVFLAQMSHELRTPVAGIIGVARSLLERPAQPSPDDRIHLIKSAAESLLQIIDDILTFSRLDARRMTLREDEFDLRLSVDDCLNLMRVDAEQKGLNMSSVVATNVPVMVRGDVLRLRQVLTNLLANSTKFTDTGSIKLECSAAALTETEIVLHFSVEDTGIGIPSENLAAIFEAFRQLDSPSPRRARESGGSGLGLAICAHLVELMGGRIWVDSLVGRGTTIHFTVRVRQAHGRSTSEIADAPRPASTLEDQPQSRSLMILVAEDDEVNGRAVVDLLEQLGHRPEWVSDGLSAVACARARTYDLILMDIRLPKLDGLDATRAIRTRDSKREHGTESESESESESQHTPIAALTAYVSEGDEARCFEAGMSAYLQKPLRADALSNIIAQLCPHPSSAHLPAPHAPATVANAAAPHAPHAPHAPSSTTPRGAPPTMEEEIVSIFLRTIPSRLDTLRTALKHADTQAIEDTAHMIAGAAANIGAHDVSQIARSMQAEAEKGHLEAARAHFDTLMQKLRVRFPSDLVDTW